MIIHAEAPRNNQPEFLRVEFSLPCGKLPSGLKTTPSIQKFRLFRRPEFDAVLTEFLKVISEDPSGDDLHIQAWQYPPGIDHIALPFGQVVPAYGSISLPLLPVL